MVLSKGRSSRQFCHKRTSGQTREKKLNQDGSRTQEEKCADSSNTIVRRKNGSKNLYVKERIDAPEANWGGA